MTDNFRNPGDIVIEQISSLFQRGRGNGKHGHAVGKYWFEDCDACDGEGCEVTYLLFVFPVEDPCDTCNGMGKVICGEIDQTPKPEYGIRGYDAEAAAQQESKDLNSKGC